MRCCTFTIFRTKETKTCDHLISKVQVPKLSQIEVKNYWNYKKTKISPHIFLASLRVYKSRRTQRENTSSWNKEKAVTIWNKSGFVIGNKLAYKIALFSLAIDLTVNHFAKYHFVSFRFAKYRKFTVDCPVSRLLFEFWPKYSISYRRNALRNYRSLISRKHESARSYRFNRTRLPRKKKKTLKVTKLSRCMNFWKIQAVIKCFERSTVQRIEDNSKIFERRVPLFMYTIMQMIHINTAIAKRGTKSW